jgi:hypothetical protein
MRRRTLDERDARRFAWPSARDFALTGMRVRSTASHFRAALLLSQSALGDAPSRNAQDQRPEVVFISRLHLDGVEAATASRRRTAPPEHGFRAISLAAIDSGPAFCRSSRTRSLRPPSYCHASWPVFQAGTLQIVSDLRPSWMQCSESASSLHALVSTEATWLISQPPRRSDPTRGWCQSGVVLCTSLRRSCALHCACTVGAVAVIFRCRLHAYANRVAMTSQSASAVSSALTCAIIRAWAPSQQPASTAQRARIA